MSALNPNRSLGLLFFGLSFACSLGLLGGCAMQGSSELIEIHGLREDRLREGGSLRLVGEGFPARGEGELIVKGRIHRPAEGAASIDTILSGKLRSAHEFEVDLDHAAILALGGRGTFRGDLELRFRGEAGSVSGSLPGVILDVEPVTREALRAIERLDESARRFFKAYGVELHAMNGEVRAQRVESGSLAEEAGLKAGDRILELAGVRAHRLADLAPADNRPSHSLLLLPAEGDAPIRLEINALASGQLLAPFHLGFIALAALLIAFMIFWGTTARFFTVFTREAPADGEGSLGWLFYMPSVERPKDARLLSVLGGLSAALGLAFIALIFIGAYLALDRVTLPAGLWIALSLSLALRLVSRLDPGIRVSMPARLLPWLALKVPLILTISTFSLIVGSADLRVIGEGQGALPWEWNLFREPLFFLLFPAFALAAFARLELRAHERGATGLATRLNLLLLSALAVKIFFGGGRLDPSLQLSGASAILAPAALFALKSTSVMLFGLYLRRSGLGRGSDAWRFALPLSVVGLALSSIHLFIEIPDAVHLVAGPLLFAAALLSFLGVLAHRFFFTRRTPLLYPFL